MRKNGILNESQLKSIMEFKQKESMGHDLVDVSKQLKNLPCTGEGVKTLIKKELTNLDYTGIIVEFLGYEDETNYLIYVVYTDGPLFVIKTKSSEDDRPCMEVSYVQAYGKVN